MQEIKTLSRITRIHEGYINNNRIIFHPVLLKAFSKSDQFFLIYTL